MKLITTTPTTGELRFIDNIKIKSYQGLVEEARSLVRQRDLFALKIAKLATKACQIKQGGKYGHYTLGDFAKEVGIDYTSLKKWVATYRMIASKIEEHIKTKEHWDQATKVTRALERERTRKRRTLGVSPKALLEKDLALPPTEVMSLYKADRDNRDHLFQCRENLSAALTNASTLMYEDGMDEDIQELIEMAGSVSLVLTKVLSVKNEVKKTKKRMK